MTSYDGGGSGVPSQASPAFPVLDVTAREAGRFSCERASGSLEGRLNVPHHVARGAGCPSWHRNGPLPLGGWFDTIPSAVATQTGYLKTRGMVMKQ